MKKELQFNLFKGTRGGRRPGSGRKRIHSKGVSHLKRETVTKRTPQHINFKFKCSIRNKDCLKLLKQSIQNAQKQGLKIIHFSLQSNHVHLITEAENNEVLTKGMRSLTITFSKGLKRGRVQLERYHLHVLKTLREAKHAIAYVLFNEQKHTKKKASKIDGYTSLLYLEDGVKLVRNYAIKNKMTLTIEKNLGRVYPNATFGILTFKRYKRSRSLLNPSLFKFHGLNTSLGSSDFNPENKVVMV